MLRTFLLIFVLSATYAVKAQTLGNFSILGSNWGVSGINLQAGPNFIPHPAREISRQQFGQLINSPMPWEDPLLGVSSIEGFRYMTEVKEFSEEGISVSAVFKPTDFKKRRFSNNHEVRIGAAFLAAYFDKTYTVEPQILTDSFHRFQNRFTSNYSTLALEATWLINTRPVKNTLAFYSGLSAKYGFQAGFNDIHESFQETKNVKTEDSSGVYNRYSVLTETYKNVTGKAFTTVGISIPAGVKFNLTCRSNVYLEALPGFNFQNFSGGPGFFNFQLFTVFGYRYKFQKPEAADNGKNTRDAFW